MLNIKFLLREAIWSKRNLLHKLFDFLLHFKICQWLFNSPCAFMPNIRYIFVLRIIFNMIWPNKLVLLICVYFWKCTENNPLQQLNQKFEEGNKNIGITLAIVPFFKLPIQFLTKALNIKIVSKTFMKQRRWQYSSILFRMFEVTCRIHFVGYKNFLLIKGIKKYEAASTWFASIMLSGLLMKFRMK